MALTLGIMSVLLSAVLAVTVVVVNQVKMMKGMGDSIVALYAADTGIELALDDTLFSQSSFNGQVGENAFYDVSVVCCLNSDPDCSFGDGECPAGFTEDSTCKGSYFCYRSLGTYMGAKRAIEIER